MVSDACQLVLVPLLWIPSATALLAVIFGPLTSVYVARREAKLRAVVLERSDQIKELRRAYSEFVAYILVCNSQRGLGRLTHQEATEKLEKAIRLETEISLMLDARIEDHRLVMGNMTDVRNRVFKDDNDKFDPRAYEKPYDDATCALTRILQSERGKILKLE